MSKNEILNLNLMLFDGGAEGGSAVATGGVSGAESVVAAQNEGRNEGQVDNAKRQAQWLEQKKNFKDFYDNEVQTIVKERLKASKADSERLKSLDPIIDLLGSKYGVTDGDANKLLEAIESDNSYFEDEAAERGMTVEQLKEVKKLERENAQLRQMREENERQALVDEQVRNWMNEADELKQIYPNFDLQTEMESERFMRILQAPGVDMRTAYEICHQQELMQAGMVVATQKAKEAVVNNIKANGLRPQENATGNTAAGSTSIDPSKLTAEQMEEFAARARRGERITFE